MSDLKLTRDQVTEELTGNGDFKGANLSGLDLSNLDFEYANLQNANLYLATFKN
ncbi:MAG: pentapeptide repeat-containing protein [Ekhidna sp.]|nr:pentapeptide repeat-containing protein [Ekhidna sp.]